VKQKAYWWDLSLIKRFLSHSINESCKIPVLEKVNVKLFKKAFYFSIAKKKIKTGFSRFHLSFLFASNYFFVWMVLLPLETIYADMGGVRTSRLWNFPPTHQRRTCSKRSSRFRKELMYCKGESIKQGMKSKSTIPARKLEGDTNSLLSWATILAWFTFKKVINGYKNQKYFHPDYFWMVNESRNTEDPITSAWWWL
jgi:hypothetical protein